METDEIGMCRRELGGQRVDGRDHEMHVQGHAAAVGTHDAAEIDDDELDVLQERFLPVDQVGQPAGAGHGDVGAAP